MLESLRRKRNGQWVLGAMLAMVDASRRRSVIGLATDDGWWDGRCTIHSVARFFQPLTFPFGRTTTETSGRPFWRGSDPVDPNVSPHEDITSKLRDRLAGEETDDGKMATQQNARHY